jgi:YqeY-like protein
MRETITAALKLATKAQDKRRVSTLRLVSAAIKDRDIAARTAGKGEATDAELLELFAKMIKQGSRRRSTGMPAVANSRHKRLRRSPSSASSCRSNSRKPTRRRRSPTRSPKQGPRASRTWAR